MNRIPLYVLNNFLKFDRKIYQVFGIRLGRPLRLKSILYFILFGLMEMIIYLVPVIGEPLRVLPASILIMIPAFLSYLLSDLGTEGRMPAAYFRSFILYQARRFQRYSYRRGRCLAAQSSYRVKGWTGIGFRRKRVSRTRSYRFNGFMKVNRQ